MGQSERKHVDLCVKVRCSPLAVLYELRLGVNLPRDKIVWDNLPEANLLKGNFP